MPGAIDGRQLAQQGAGRSRFLPDLGSQGKPMPIPPPVEQTNERFPISTKSISERAGPGGGIPPTSPAVVQALQDAALKPILLKQGHQRGKRVNTTA